MEANFEQFTLLLLHLLQTSKYTIQKKYEIQWIGAALKKIEIGLLKENGPTERNSNCLKIVNGTLIMQRTPVDSRIRNLLGKHKKPLSNQSPSKKKL